MNKVGSDVAGFDEESCRIRPPTAARGWQGAEAAPSELSARESLRLPQQDPHDVSTWAVFGVSEPHD